MDKTCTQFDATAQEYASTHGFLTCTDILRHYRNWQRSTNGEYKSMDGSRVYASVHDYIVSHFPTSVDILLDENYMSTAGLVASAFTPKQLVAADIEVKDTIVGSFLPPASVETIHSLSTKCLPLLPFFKMMSNKLPCDTTRDYTSFARKCWHKKLAKALPFLSSPDGDKWFYSAEDESELSDFFVHWANLLYAEKCSVPADCIPVVTAASILKVSKVVLLSWLFTHPADVSHIGCLIYPKSQSIQRISVLRQKVLPLDALISEITRSYKVHKVELTAAMVSCTDQTLTRYVFNPPELLVSNVCGWYYLCDYESTIKSSLESSISGIAVHPIQELSLITELNISALIDFAQNGSIDCECIDNKYYVSAVEIARLQDMQRRFVSLKAVVEQIVPDNSLFDFRSKDWNALCFFASQNDWWGVKTIDAAKLPMNSYKSHFFINRTDTKKIQDKLYLWLNAYAKTNEERAEILISCISTRFPNTAQQVSDFFKSEKSEGSLDDSAVVNMLDALLYLLDCDISRMSESDIQSQIIDYFAKNCSRVSCACLSSFLYKSGLSNHDYAFQPTGTKPNTSAYSMDDFSKMAYLALNQESWNDNLLIEKAIENKAFAYMWLFIILHFFAAWRSTDFARLCPPPLVYSPDETLRRIKTGIYHECDAKRVTLSFIEMIKTSGMVPNKTSGTKYVPNLQFFCPRSCEYPLGIVLSIASAHYLLNKETTEFPKQITNVRYLKEFFGDSFALACNNRPFSTRRANKSLLQATADAADKDSRGGQPNGYILASLMRSHKGGLAKLSNTTSIYLKDAKFSGMSADFIAGQMLERGVCSFVVDALLKICFPDYSNLPIPEQTEIIRLSGLSAYNTISIVNTVRKAENDANDAIRCLMAGTENNKDTALHVLTMLISDMTNGKDVSSSTCLACAAGNGCQEPSRLSCFGCKFELKTKALLLDYLYEYRRLIDEAKKGGSIIEIERHKAIIGKAIYPAVVEIVSCLKKQISSQELKIYQEFAEEVLNGNQLYCAV